MFISSRSLKVINTEKITDSNISNADLVKKMCATEFGVGFVNEHIGLPKNTFISDDAVVWLLNYTTLFNSRSEAVKRLQVNIFKNS